MNDEDLRTVETYRLELYMQACENLSAENEAVRLSGAQTLVGLGDIWHSDKTFPEETRREHVQKIIDTLCAYIRSPFHIATKIKNNLEKIEGRVTRQDIQHEIDILATDEKVEYISERNVRKNILLSIYNRVHVPAKSMRHFCEIHSGGRDNSGIWSSYTFNFSGSVFFYPIQFRYAHWGARVDMSDCVYLDAVRMQHSRYMTFVDFSHSIFYCDVDLRGISYVRRMSRRDSIYHGKADLRSSYYGGTANLSGSVYYDKAIFADSEFRLFYFKTVSFRNSIYHSKVNFRYCFYHEDVNFSDSVYCDAVDYRYSTYLRESNFSESTYYKRVNFAQSIYWYSLFINNTYHEYVNFSGSIYGWSVDFRNSWYRNKPKFSSFNSRWIKPSLFSFERLGRTHYTDFSTRTDELLGESPETPSIEPAPQNSVLPVGCRFLTEEEQKYCQDTVYGPYFDCNQLQKVLDWFAPKLKTYRRSKK